MNQRDLRFHNANPGTRVMADRLITRPHTWRMATGCVDSGRKIVAELGDTGTIVGRPTNAGFRGLEYTVKFDNGATVHGLSFEHDIRRTK